MKGSATKPLRKTLGHGWCRYCIKRVRLISRNGGPAEVDDHEGANGESCRGAGTSPDSRRPR